jgi:hypothetical protein
MELQERPVLLELMASLELLVLKDLKAILALQALQVL